MWDGDYNSYNFDPLSILQDQQNAGYSTFFFGVKMTKVFTQVNYTLDKVKNYATDKDLVFFQNILPLYLLG